LKARLISSDQQEKWNAFAYQGSTFGLLQGWEWGAFKEKLGWEVKRIAVEEGDKITAAAQMLIKYLPGKLASIAYIPRGPLVDWSDDETLQCLLNEVHRVARQQHAIFLKIEPPIRKTIEYQEQLQKLSFRASAKTNQPRNTIILDITPEPDALLLQMRQKTRQYIRRAEREGITIRIGSSEDLHAYIELMHETGKREHFPARSEKYYENEYEALSQKGECALLIAQRDGKLLAARTVCFFGSHAAEFHAGSVGGSDNLHPNYLLVWEAIKLAKSKGCVSYDLWGIPDEIEGNVELDEPSYLQRRDGLWGVYRFKSGFSRNVISYIGAYDYVYAPLPYAIAATSLIGNESFERIAVWVDSLRRADPARGG